LDGQTFFIEFFVMTRSHFLWLYREFKSFFSTGIFYIALGAIFLWIACKQSNQLHPALTFLIAILGVAVLLYGTGTQAAGSGNTGQLNVAIAGGAGVLAAVFGFGVLQYHDKIGKVFRYQKDYGVIELNSDVRILDFDNYDVTAELTDGAPLPQWKRRQMIGIMVPINAVGTRSEVTIFIKDRKAPDTAFHENYILNWASEKVIVETSSGSPVTFDLDRDAAGATVYTFRRVIPLNPARAEVFHAASSSSAPGKVAIEAE
jgi:hypothetical protein